jgi:hypothetical protein
VTSTKNRRTNDTTITPVQVELILSTVTGELSHQWLPNIIVGWAAHDRAVNLRESLIADATAATIADLLDPIVAKEWQQSSDSNLFVITLAKRHARQLRKQATDAVTEAASKNYGPPQSDDPHDDAGDTAPWDFIPRGRIWPVKEKVEQDAVQRLDGPAELTPWQQTAQDFYRRAVEVVGQENVNFIIEYWSKRWKGDQPAPSRERVRFHRLEKKLANMELGPLLDGVTTDTEGVLQLP